MSTPGRKRKRAVRINVLGWLVAVSLTGLWQVAVGLKWIDYSSVPDPSQIIRAAGGLIKSGELQSNISHTLLITVISALLAALIGTITGVLMGLIPMVRAYLTGSIDFMRTIPVVGLFAVVVLIWGTSASAEVAVATYAATWVIVLDTLAGVHAVRPLQWDVAKMLHLSRTTTIRKIVLPAAMPMILIGYRLAVVTALVVAITAEMLVNAQGIGWGLIKESQALQPAKMWVYVVVSGVLGYLVNLVLVRLVRLALPGASVVGSK